VAEDSREAIELMEQHLPEFRGGRAREPEEEPPSAGQGAVLLTPPCGAFTRFRPGPVDAGPRAERGDWRRMAVDPTTADVRVYCAFRLPLPREGPGIYCGAFPEVWQVLCYQRGETVEPWSITRHATLEEARTAWFRCTRTTTANYSHGPPLWLVFRD
jgi:hypothetical protein